MKDNRENPLQIAIHCPDDRFNKMMMLFFKGAYEQKVKVVQEDEAEAEIIDVDTAAYKSILENKLQQTPKKPLIVLSLQELSQEGIIYLKKPLQTAQLQEAITKAKSMVEDNRSHSAFKNKSSGRQIIESAHDSKNLREPSKARQAKSLENNEHKKTSKHKTAMYLDEQGFSSFIGSVSDINFRNPEHIKSASYNAKNYFQGYVQSAIKLSISKNRILRLNSSWKPLYILPKTREIWVDANDKQLRAFSSVPINTISSVEQKGISVTPIDAESGFFKTELEKFQSMDAFLWKLAIWTSKGRFPQGLDLEKPIYLKRWPNFTRLVIPPHALRITALLMDGPRTLTNVAEVLNIKPQFVFAYFSAVYTTGLAGQCDHVPDKTVTQKPLRSSEKKGLLTRILHRLSGSTN